MIPGLEGRFAWTPAGEEEPAVTLGLLRDDEGREVWPRYRIRNIGGLMGGGDPEDNRDAPPGRLGEIARLSQRRGKSVTFSGAIQARTLLELREAEADLRAAFAAMTEGRMDATWHPSNTEFDAVPPKFFEARALTCEVVDVQEAQGWERAFVIGLRMGDPRYFDEETERHEVSIRETNTAVGW